MSPFVLWAVALLCMLLCVVECHLYCVIPSYDAPCHCQDSCLTLSEISTNTTYYLDSNTSLILQPGDHTLDSNLTVSNISVFKLYSEGSLTTRITCNQFASFYFFEVSTIEITGLEFVACTRSSVTRSDNFALQDSILISENGSSTALVLNQTLAASIVNCSFQGAAVSIVHQSFVVTNDISISDNKANPAALMVYDSSVVFNGSTTFTSNQGTLLAYSATIQFMGSTSFSNCTTVTSNSDSHMTLPYVRAGGGAISSCLSRLTFQGHTTFTNNRAKYGGAIYAIESFILLAAKNSHLSQSNSTVSDLGTVISFQNNAATSSGGGMYLYRSTMVVRNADYQFIANSAYEKGGGIYLAYSDIKLEVKTTSLVLTRNRAELGGGFYLEGNSRLQMYSTNTSIKLIENDADYGAAIFVDDNTKYGTCLATATSSRPEMECFFRLHNPDMSSISVQVESRVTASNNTARYSGSDLFGGLLDRCITSSEDNAITTVAVHGEYAEGLAYFQSISNINSDSITSAPVRVCFCTQDWPDCSLKSLTKEVQKGQSFTVSIAAVDQVGAPVSANILTYLSSTQGKGGNIQVADGCTSLSYTIFPLGDSETLNLYADGPCRDAELSRLAVTLHFSPCTCPVGFQFNTTNNETSCECICDPLIYPEYISSCSIQPEPLIERKTNSWINPLTGGETNETIYIISPICPFRYCLGHTSINLNTQEGLMAQCIPGRNGTLCGACSTNYSFAVSGKRCVQCPDLWPLLFTVIVIGSLLAGLGMVISIMAMNFTVAVGTINGFIFYANIIDVYDVVFLPFTQPNFPELLIEWLNLDPGIDVCLFPNYNAYHLTWIRLLFPLYIIFIVIVIIVISSNSVRFSTLIGKRNPIAVLATLILLSYANFLETALLILTPSTLTTVSSTGSQEDVVWFLDGDIKYLDRTHIPLFLVALFILILAIVYKIIIFSWQWVVRLPKVWILKWTDNQKLNSFIQTYQAPFSDRHRYWTGLLLLLRLLLTLILSFTASRDPNSSIIAIILSLGILFLLRLTYAKNLYKKWPLDLLETVLIFNLFALATLAYTYNDDHTRRILAYISVSFTTILLLIVVAYHIYAYILISIFPKLKREKYSLRSNSRQNATELRTPGNIIYSQDRFLENIGSTEPANVSNESTSLKPTRKPMPKILQEVTHSVISFSDLRDEYQPELQVVIEENTFEAPYREVTETDTQNSDDSDRCASTQPMLS